MQNSKSIISCAALIAEVLGDAIRDEKVSVMAYPVIAPEKAVCPYVVYRRAKIMTRPDKSGSHADTALVEVLCCGSTYAQSVEVAEFVRKSLDGVQSVSDDGSLSMRSCTLSDATEGWESQTFIQKLTFTVRMN